MEITEKMWENVYFILKKLYAKTYMKHDFNLRAKLDPLQIRYDAGERSDELYNAIMELA